MALSVGRLFGVAGKSALVTGGGRGIGRMITQALVENGSRVYITSRNVKACEEVAAALSKEGPGECIALPSTDLSKEDGCTELANLLTDREEKLNILVNNSGTSFGAPFKDYPGEAWDKVMGLNVKSVFLLTRSILPLLQAASAPEDPGRVINIGSIAGVMPQPVPTYAYDASKAAIHMLTRKLAYEFSGKGEREPKRVTVNAIAPGMVPSKMSQQLLTYTDESTLAGAIPMGRFGTPEDLGGVALYLSSRAGAWVTGQVIPVDGGSTAQPIPFFQ